MCYLSLRIAARAAIHCSRVRLPPRSGRLRAGDKRIRVGIFVERQCVLSDFTHLMLTFTLCLLALAAFVVWMMQAVLERADLATTLQKP